MTEKAIFDIEEYTKSLEKRFGKGVVKDATTILDNPRKVISVCPSLDIGLSGRKARILSRC